MDRLNAIDEGPLDGLLDPPTGVRAEAGAVFRIEAFDGLEETDVSLFDQIGEGQTAVDIMLGDVDDQSQVGADHLLAGDGVVFADDSPAQFLFLIGGEQGRLVDLPQIKL